jgi:hypothetical protein
MNDFIEEIPPKHMIGVRDPLLNIVYWVFSDDFVSFDAAKKIVADFVAKRVREHIDYEKAYNLPPEVILVVGKDNQVKARNLASPEELDRRRHALKK